MAYLQASEEDPAETMAFSAYHISFVSLAPSHPFVYTSERSLIYHG